MTETMRSYDGLSEKAKGVASAILDMTGDFPSGTSRKVSVWVIGDRIQSAIDQVNKEQFDLIKQLGEALALVVNEKYCGLEPATTATGCYTDSDDEVSARLAMLAYNNWKRGRGE